MSRHFSIPIGTLLLMWGSLPAFASAHIHRGPTAHRVDHHQAYAAGKAATPRVMASARAIEIQSALIRNGYLSGSPSGVWDVPTELAMQKYQAANGWQTRLTPDSRALIKLGLGSTPSAETGTFNGSSSSIPVAPAMPALDVSSAGDIQ